MIYVDGMFLKIIWSDGQCFQSQEKLSIPFILLAPQGLLVISADGAGLLLGGGVLLSGIDLHSYFQISFYSFRLA